MLIQCVPNFSEGRDTAAIAAIAGAIGAAAGVRVVDCSADADHHRTVVTFLGEPAAVVEAAVAGAAEAVRRIDLTQHRGEHPRLGAVDVVPFVPVGETGMEACVEAAHCAGERMAAELGLPVYFYEAAAVRPDRTALPAIRGGGFNALRGAPLEGARAPDLGPTQLHPTAGAVVVGARGPLTAFNVNLRTADVAIARQIARRIRERDGGLVGVRALGLELPSRGMVQVSVNVTQPDRVPLYRVLELVRLEAARHGVLVAGTELVGACRLEELLEVARFALGMHDLNARQILDLAVVEMGG
jgi:glutamate formiminotransferase / 5-formyltetrahydrofolate cyclo-ligase